MMKIVRRLFCFCLVSLLVFLCYPVVAQSKAGTPVSIIIAPDSHSRIVYGAQKLSAALLKAGYSPTVTRSIPNKATPKIFVGVSSATFWSGILLPAATPTGKESFTIQSLDANTWAINGADNSGALYGCLELVDQLQKSKKLPQQISITDQPEMVMRGACIGVQKPVYLPGRHVYEYPYTPESFPWFYDKALWIQYLDSLAENRYNSLYLWNGHPFASLVRLKDYPYAVEVDDSTFKKNEEIYSFITQEADRRGIWVIQTFYNIIVSKPFAEKHNLVTQDRNRPIIPLIADYTRKSIAAFVAKYPNVGLMVTLGEAMEGVGQDDVEWFTKTIIPGVKDGLQAAGITNQPPLVLRAHDTDAPMVMEAAKPLYSNLYTVAKYNGEALTTYTPRGPWAELHQRLSAIGTVHIENVHILANLEPFRYASPDFIQKSVLAMHNVYGANGLHLYPESSYWDWPYSADKASPRLLQIERDWLWYKAWARYAWKSARPRAEETAYWSKIMGAQFGAGPQAGNHILTAYEETGEIAPKLLRRFGITDGNRQTLTLGMLMTQLINPYRYGLFTLLYNSEGPEGEMLTEWAEKEWKGQPHTGETPVQIINEVKNHATAAVKAIDAASININKNTPEFSRLKNDVYAYHALAYHYATKASAALQVLRYKYSNNISDLEKALPLLQQSVDHFKRLADLTKNTYLYANSMQTQQRKIPVPGTDGTMKTWVELLPVYQEELNTFKQRLDSLRKPQSNPVAQQKAPLQNASVTLLDSSYSFYNPRTGSSLFSDTGTYIKDYAEELTDLNALQLNKSRQLASGTTVRFKTDKPVQVLVGYFNHPDRRFLQPPTLEIDATANDYGQAEIKIANALLVSGMPPVNVHTYNFSAGTHTLTLGKGASLILGFVPAGQPVPRYDTGLVAGGVKKELDWLFE